MTTKFEYSFDDEPVRRFCYDLDLKKIEVHFIGYYHISKDDFFEQPCIFIIENWKDAKSKIGDDEMLYELNKHMGVFSMIYFMEQKGDNLEMLINTIDNRYITFIFINPQLSLKLK